MWLRLVLTPLLILAFILPATPCGWDSDTISMERREFPSVHELMVGQFLRHSDEFYYWRVKDRTELLALYPDSLALYDDLGVALDKIGEHEQAIQTMLDKDKLNPGQYETYANLGTFYIHNRQYEEGLRYIKDAIVINPEAHFGREVYQQYVVEYLLSRQDDTGAVTLPLRRGNQHFYHFLKERHIDAAIDGGSSTKAELAKAIKGIAGMMRFGHFDSPVLLEVIADLLSTIESGEYETAGNLASRAYLKASYELKDEEARKSMAALAKEAREYSFGPEFHGLNGEETGPERGSHATRWSDLQVALKLEVQAGEAWFQQVRADEMKWIAEGINPDSMFTLTYYEAPVSESFEVERVTRNRVDEIDEEYWLNKQTQAPALTSLTNASPSLSEEEKEALDEIYAREFARPAPVLLASLNSNDVDSLGTASEGAGDAPQGEGGITLKALLLFGGVVLVIGLYLMLRDSKKAKDEDAA